MKDDRLEGKHILWLILAAVLLLLAAILPAVTPDKVPHFCVPRSTIDIRA